MSESTAPSIVLRSPSKLIVTSAATMFVSDTGNQRVLQLELAPDQRSAAIVRVFGTGDAAFVDGDADRAAFRSPRGLARRGRTLHVADTENHAVRAIDLESGHVRTVAGTGRFDSTMFEPGNSPTTTAIGSPSALWLQRPHLFIASEDDHRVLSLEDETSLLLFAGTGRTGHIDGPALTAGFDRPSDICGNGRELFIADSSAVRAIGIEGRPLVRTIVGTDASESADVDGIGERVRLNHPKGLAFDGLLFIADTGNNKIKRLDPSTRETKKFIGTGEPGHVDGPFYKSELNAPQGVAVRDKYVYIADTENHAIRVGDMKRLRLHTLEIVRSPST